MGYVNHVMVMNDIDFLLTDRGKIKLSDFGLARIYDERDEADMSHQICTRQYRPPELLFASRRYGPSIDIWGLGVIFVELITLKTCFPGNNDIDQMSKVFQVLGTPKVETWPDVVSLPDYSKVRFPDMEPMPWGLIMPHVGVEEHAFVSRFLQLNPAHRISAMEAEGLEYFGQAPFPCPCSLLSHHKLFHKETEAASGAGKNGIKDVASYLNTMQAALGIGQDQTPEENYSCIYAKPSR
eukprot:scaffold833_cov177-Ochromonas_danica.AAC.3